MLTLTELMLISVLRFHQPHHGRFTFLNACSAKRNNEVHFNLSNAHRHFDVSQTYRLQDDRL